MADQHNTHRAQYRVCVPQVLACIRRNIAVDTRGGNRMRESCKYGSVRGARGNSRPYRAAFRTRILLHLLRSLLGTTRKYLRARIISAY